MNDFTERLESAEQDLVEAGKELASRSEAAELRECQVKKLSCELNRCEAELVRNLQLQQKYEDDKAKLNAENRKLLNTSETLKQNLEILEKEMNELRGDNEALHEELKRTSYTAEEDKDGLLNYYKAKCEEFSSQNRSSVFHKVNLRMLILWREERTILA